jgi:hypothetical protein
MLQPMGASGKHRTLSFDMNKLYWGATKQAPAPGWKYSLHRPIRMAGRQSRSRTAMTTVQTVRNTMELRLASAESICALMPVYENPARVRPTPIPVRLRRGAQNIAKRAHKGLCCNGGQCRRCLDNTRWERIFAEKFEDPTYYTHPITRGGSSLTSLIQLGPSGG